MESSSVKKTHGKIESETTEPENVVKPHSEIKTEEDIKIKLEPNDEEGSQDELHELIWLDSNLVVEQEGQLISEAIFLFSFEPKNEQNYFLISALASKKS